jgi:CRISPR/Cas system-associated protein Cas7 (RAMP superfamily)
MAQRYNVLPSELMHSSLLDFSFNLRVWQVGLEKDVQEQKKMQQEMKQKQQNSKMRRR